MRKPRLGRRGFLETTVWVGGESGFVARSVLRTASYSILATRSLLWITGIVSIFWWSYLRALRDTSIRFAIRLAERRARTSKRPTRNWLMNLVPGARVERAPPEPHSGVLAIELPQDLLVPAG